MKLSEIDDKLLTDGFIDRLLYSCFAYDGSPADLIMVLGSKSACKYRLPVAAKLFGEGRADTLLFTGGKEQDSGYGVIPEYLSLLKAANDMGLPRQSILVETISMSTAENFEFSKGIIRERLPDCKKIILVTTDYHMLRATLLASKKMPEYSFIPCPAAGNSTRRERWRWDKNGRETVINEVLKLRWYASNGFINDIEI